MKSIYTLSILAILLFTSCERDSYIELPAHNSMLVINCKFNTDSLWLFRVSESLSMLDTANIKYNTSATIKILKDGQVVETLNNANQIKDGFYQSRTQPEIAETYSIEVSSNGFPTATASETLPKSIQVEDIETEIFVTEHYRDEYEVYDDEGNIMPDTMEVFEYWEFNYNISFVINDNSDESNYYSFFMYTQDTSYAWNEETFEEDTSKLAIYKNTVYLESNDPSVVILNNSTIFNDELFNGKNKRITFKGVGYSDKPSQRYYLKINALSEAYDNYERSYELYWNKDGDPFSEPVQVYSNVNNGFGIFAGFSAATDSVDVRFNE